MRYKLQRNANGMITQCENADGGNIYAQREELNKKALENLQRPTPGKLGNLSNLQYFNFQISDISSATSSFILQDYNTTNNFPANVTQAIMFGVDGINNKALYYNIVSLNAVFDQGGVSGSSINIINPSHISFYLLQNIETSTTSLGTKIPQPAPLYGNGGGVVTFTTDGNDYGNQSISCDLVSDQGLFAQNNDTKGIRCSGLALKEITVNLASPQSLSNVALNISVGVDVSSVSSSY